MASTNAVEQYAELACEHDRLRLYGVLQLDPKRVANAFLVDEGHTHVLVHARVGYVEKWGRPAALVHSGASWDELLRFSIAVVPARRHPLNLVKLTLYSINGHEPEKLRHGPQREHPEQLCEVGAAIFHLHDMLRATDDGEISDTFLFWNDFQTVGELHLGVNFFYGEFGQGQSERLLWTQDEASDTSEVKEEVDGIANTDNGIHQECNHHLDEIGEDHITECFESLYLAAAEEDNEIKAARTGVARIESFVQSHSQLTTHEERLAFVRHQIEAPAMQPLQRIGSRATSSKAQDENGRDSANTQNELACRELPMLPSGLLPLNANTHRV